LKPAVGAVVLEIVLWSGNAGDIATHRAIAWSAGLLIIDAEIGVISEKIELVAEYFQNCAGKILGLGERQVVECFVDHTERTILACCRRKVDFGASNSGQLNDMW
jgi:hypothetical protein